MIQPKAPPLSSHQRKQVEEAKASLEDALNSIAARYKKLAQLQEKEADVRNEAEILDRKARNFDRKAEAQLVVVSKQLSRIQAEIEAVESGGDDNADRSLLSGAVYGAQELLSRLCQSTFEQLVEMQVDAMAPFWSDLEAARRIARTSTASVMFASQILKNDHYLLSEAAQFAESAKGLVSKLNALLEKSVIWKFEGARPEEAHAAS